MNQGLSPQISPCISSALPLHGDWRRPDRFFENRERRGCALLVEA
jgi:hypothetical protein